MLAGMVLGAQYDNAVTYANLAANPTERIDILLVAGYTRAAPAARSMYAAKTAGRRCAIHDAQANAADGGAA
jgi:hypothetical protein